MERLKVVKEGEGSLQQVVNGSDGLEGYSSPSHFPNLAHPLPPQCEQHHHLVVDAVDV